MAFSIDHTSSGNIFLKGFCQNFDATYIFNPLLSIDSYQETYLNEISEDILPIENLPIGEFLGDFIPSEDGNGQSAEISLNFIDFQNELLISGTSINSIFNLQEELSLKENLTNLGDVHDQNTGIFANDIVVVEVFEGYCGSINPLLISSYAIKDTFVINGTGELITLSNSDIGDVAIDIANNNNYILCSNESQAYLNIDNWITFTGFGGKLLYINGHAPNGLGNIDIDSNEIYYCAGSASISDKISETNVATTGMLQNYQKCNLFLNQTGKYTLTNTFDNIASTKTSEYHEHEISGIINLSGRLEVLKFLNTGNLVDSQRSYSYFLGNQNYTYAYNSLILGQYGLSCYNSEVVYTPSNFCTVETGNLQSSIIIGTGITSSDNCISLKEININEHSFHFLIANIVGRSEDCQVCAGYNLYANIARESGCAFKIQDTAYEIKGENLNIDFNIICDNLYSLDLSGYLNKSMKWFSKINVIQIQDTGYNLFIGTE